MQQVVTDQDLDLPDQEQQELSIPVTSTVEPDILSNQSKRTFSQFNLRDSNLPTSKLEHLEEMDQL